MNGRRSQSDEPTFGKRRRLVLFVGVALFLLGGAAGSDVAAAVGAVTALSTVLVWSSVGGALDRIAHAVHGVRLRTGALWSTLGRGATDEPDPVDRLQQRYADDEITEAEFERRMETVLRTDDEEVAEMIVEE